LALKDFLTIYDTVIPRNNVIVEYEKVAKKIFQKIQTNNLQIQTLTQLRDSLLPKLMSGEVRMPIKN
jgi:type I restriction enzyme S subunit